MANPNGNAALFFDLGGTLLKLNEQRSLPLDAKGKVIVELLPNVAEKLRPMHNHLMFVVTNQAGIGRGWFKREAVEDALANSTINSATFSPHGWFVRTSTTTN